MRRAVFASILLACGVAFGASPDAPGGTKRPESKPEMVAIPAASFVMGAGPDKPIDFIENEVPAHGVGLDAYSLMRYEVTLGQWVEFLNKVGGFMAWHPRQAVNFTSGLFEAAVDPSTAASGMDWSAARAFCRWHGMDLPTEAQWERAARGDGFDTIRHYPWGEAGPRCKLANIASEPAFCTDGPEPVGGHPEGASVDGVFDLAGNVAEWVRDWHADYAPGPTENPTGPATGTYKVIRGGSFISFSERAHTMARDNARPETHSRELGFRCASVP